MLHTPYVRFEDNLLAVAAHTSLVIVYLAVLVIKVTPRAACKPDMLHRFRAGDSKI